MSTTSPPIAPPRTGGRLLLWAGVACAFVGPVLYVVQMSQELLTVPWYAPALATLGSLAIVLSLMRRVTAWRLLSLALVVAVTAGQWWFLLSFSRNPAYAGELAGGKPFPQFTAALADGKPFTQDNLKGDQDTVLVFFRGHW
jgi:hypothetical protein